MNIEKRQVSTSSELRAAAADASVQHIVVAAPINEVPTLHLSHGQTLTGFDAQSVLRFAAGEHGLRLSADNRVESLQLVADPDRCAVFRLLDVSSGNASAEQVPDGCPDQVNNAREGCRIAIAPGPGPRCLEQAVECFQPGV